MSQLYCKNRERTIKNAASIAGLMLTTEALVADMKEDDKKSAESTYGAEDRCRDRVAVWMVRANADPSLARDDRSSTAILATCYGDTKGAANGTVPFDCLHF